MVDSLINKAGRQVAIYRTYTENADLSSTQYLAPSQFQVGILNEAIVESDTALTIPVPISAGTVCDDGSNTLTGDTGADNSTDNTTTYKQGANVYDDTAQNLIANDTSATKRWSISNLASAGSNASLTKYIGYWLYIKDQTTLDKFYTATAIRTKIGSDSSNWYYYDYDIDDLEIGWNWVSSYPTLLGDLSDSGSPTGDMDFFQIRIVTNNATDEFTTGDVIYDLLRQWEDSDLFKDFQSGYPTFNMSTIEATTRCYLNSLEANGFLLDVIGCFNKDTTELLTSEDKYEGDSKSKADEFAFVQVDQFI